MNFTCKRSDGGELPFLDIKVQQNSGHFKTQLFAKPVNLGQCLNGNSEWPDKYKNSVVSTFVKRALTHYSSWKDFHQEIERVSQCLVNNGYSNHHIN